MHFIKRHIFCTDALKCLAPALKSSKKRHNNERYSILIDDKMFEEKEWRFVEFGGDLELKMAL